MKLGCISWSHRAEFSDDRLNIFRWIRHCARDAKLDGVEIWNNHLTSLDTDYLDSITALCREEGVELYSVATKCQYGDFSDKEVEESQKTLRQWLAATNRLGASIMRVSIGGNALRDPLHQRTVFRSIADVVREGGYSHIAVGVENQEPGVLQDFDDVRLMNDETDGILKVILDNGSIVDKTTVYEFMKNTIPFAAVIHLKFFDVAENGADKVIDYERVAEIVKASGYNGYLSIEYDSNGLASEDVPKIAGFLRTLFQET